MSFAYREAPVLSDVNLAIDKQSAVCIVGPNGGGKTTLVKLVIGLLRPTSGRIRIFGQETRTQRHRIGYMPQHINFDPLFPITVEEVIRMGLVQFPMPWSRQRQQRTSHTVTQVMHEMGLQARAGELFGSLSGGLRQRTLIARALVSDPQILILDEPTAMIDTAYETQLLESLREMRRKITLVLVSHDLGFVAQFVDTVICVNQVAYIHPTSELSGETIKSMYGADIQMVRHDHRCSEKGHSHV